MKSQRSVKRLPVTLSSVVRNIPVVFKSGVGTTPLDELVESAHWYSTRRAVVSQVRNASRLAIDCAIGFPVKYLDFSLTFQEEELGLAPVPKRTTNSLKSANIGTWRGVMWRSARQLAEIDGLGRKSIDDVIGLAFEISVRARLVGK